MSVLVVGSVALDSISTPEREHKDMLGGSATYFSLAASHFSSVNIVAVVGDDFPMEARQLLIAKSIDLQGLQTVEGKTFRWHGEYRGAMNEAITHDTQLNVFEGFKPVIPQTYQNTEWVFLGNIDPVLQQQVLDQMTKPKLVALDTMNFWIEGKHNELVETLHSVDLLIINEMELRMLANATNIVKAAGIVSGMGPHILVIKRGEYGSILYRDGNWFFVPGYPEETVIDPTGAGDSFAGGFMGALSKFNELTMYNLKQAMVYGSVMASFNITGFGPWKLAKLTPAQIDDRFKAFRQLVSF